MPQSLSSVLLHLVFSTKRRIPSIPPTLGPELHAYLAGILQNLGCRVVQVGGVDDHVHLLFYLGRTRSIATVVEAVKTGSSKWLKAKGIADFAWQEGYGVFSAGKASEAAVATYIRGQEEHHRRQCFQDELRSLLRHSGVDFDERYLWD